jgi:site-specific DNA recombinase
MRAVIYARYSSENQNERSIDDQVRLCRELAARLNHDVFGIYADYAISGSSLKNRPEANRLMADSREGKFDVILAEALDRLSRDQEDIAGIHKRLGFAGIALHTLAEGEVSELHVGLKGTMNALFLKDLAAKVRRGQRGRIEAGRAAGGLSYGYRVVRELDAKGDLVRGLREIDPDEAAVVRRIFAAYAAGQSGRAIAAALNHESIKAPSGKQWNASTINGNVQRGNGILFNPLYIGKLVYNRLTMVKDPETGRRLSRLNKQAEWITVEAPDLRIVDDMLWQAVQQRKRAVAGIPALKQQRPRHLLSGLLRCGACGGAYVVSGKDYLRCSRRHESGACTGSVSVRLSEVERRTLDGLRAKLLAPDIIRAAVEAYHAERRRLRGAETSRRRDLAKRIPQLGREIERLVDRICQGSDSPASNARLAVLETEKTALEQELAALDEAAVVVDAHPGAIEAYTRAIDRLSQTLTEQRDADSVDQLRRLVDRIVITRGAQGSPVEITLYGRLAELLDLPSRTSARNIRQTSSTLVVAGEGFEPPTLGL